MTYTYFVIIVFHVLYICVYMYLIHSGAYDVCCLCVCVCVCVCACVHMLWWEFDPFWSLSVWSLSEREVCISLSDLLVILVLGGEHLTLGCSLPAVNDLCCIELPSCIPPHINDILLICWFQYCCCYNCIGPIKSHKNSPGQKSKGSLHSSSSGSTGIDDGRHNV